MSSGAEPHTPEAAFSRNQRAQRKVRTGVVASSGMDKTVVVEIIQTVRHDLYGKTYRRRRKLYAHDETNAAKTGDRVLVAETRPLSKLKRWRVVEILERAT
ncbi:MAG: 30S ribosomal protein S17 [Actinomycetota bacterium]